MPKKTTVYFVLFCVLASFAMAGCSVKPLRPQVVASPNTVDLRLADAADRATRALETLASVEQTRTPTAGAAYLPNVPPELQKATTFSWNGPAEPVVQNLANMIGYQFTTLGKAPVAPVVVALSPRNQPVAETLRDIGLQLGTRAELRLDAARRVIEIVYPAVANPTRG